MLIAANMLCVSSNHITDNFANSLFSTNRTSEQHSDLYLEASSGATSSASGGDPLTLFSLTYSNHDRTPADVIASGVLTANYCQEVYKELVRWHERITLGTAAITAPMYILYWYDIDGCWVVLGLLANQGEIGSRDDMIVACIHGCMHGFMDICGSWCVYGMLHGMVLMLRI